MISIIVQEESHGITRVTGVTMNVCSKSHGKSFSGYQGIFVQRCFLFFFKERGNLV